MMKKTVSVLILIIMVVTLFAFAGCSDTQKPICGSVTIIGPDGKIILDAEVTITKKNATAADVVKMECSSMKVPYTCENGMFDNFDGIASTNEEGWLLYSEYKLAEVGAEELLLEDNLIIECK